MSKNIYVGTMRYNLIYIFAIHDDHHNGYLKIGEHHFDSTSSANQLAPNCPELEQHAHFRIEKYTKTGFIQYDLLHVELALKPVQLADGSVTNTSFRDKAVHDVLNRSAYEVRKFYDTNRPSEWYKVPLHAAISAIRAVKEGRNVLTPAEKNGENQLVINSDTFTGVAPAVVSSARPSITLRDEQLACITKTQKIFKTHDRMLWDCKMRFGKTVTAYSLVKQMQYQKVIVVTHRPAVVDGWHDDFDWIFAGENRSFVTKANIKESDRFTTEDPRIDAENDRNLSNLAKAGTPFVYFASMQDLRGSKLAGGKYDKNCGVFEMDWDIIIYDEAHEGTQTELGLGVQKLLETPKAGKQPKKVLQLSGTPYNLLNQYDGENVYSWDYVMEQKAKKDWEENHPGDHNPYADLPEMRICTFDLRKKMHGSYRYEDENIAFNFREFFRTWTGDPARDFRPLPAGVSVGDFVHREDVWEFLNLISTESDDSNYPFATQEYRDMFRHTFWILPGVKEARAFSAMLKMHPVFKQFEVVNVAGEGDVEQPYDDALKAVREAIKNHSHTITLSCGKLTTGVTVKEWTGVMLLSGSASTGAAGYMQTIFRVQSAGSIDGKQKTVCYAFDFAPDRALKVLSEVHKLKKNSTGSEDNGRIQLGEFLNFCPVLAEGDTGMEFYDVPKMMRQLKRLTVDAAVKSGFDDDSVYKADAGIVMDQQKIQLVDLLKRRLTPQKKSKKEKSVSVNEQGLTDEQYRKAQEAKHKPKKQRTKEELEALEKEREMKKKQQALFDLLRNISIRLPLLIYGTATEFNESIRLADFITIVDPASWKEFMPKEVDKELFQKLLVFYDEDVIEGAGMRIRRLAKAADELMPTQRVQKIAEIFSYFRNPAKETVLTPWRVVNMHMGDTIGGYNFYKEGYPQKDGILETPRLIEQGEVTSDLFLNENVRILEMNSKSGLYPLYVAYSIYRMLLPKAEHELTLEEAQTYWQRALENHLFVLCQTEMAVSITKRTLAGYNNFPVNAIYLTHLLDRMDNQKRLANLLARSDTWGKEGDKMKFNAIVGNPPYQEMDSDNGRGASSVFPGFVQTAKRLNPDYISMIMPARWYAGGKNLDEFRDEMLADYHITKLYDYEASKEIFPTADIAGGLCFFLWDAEKSDRLCSVINISGETRNEVCRPLDEYPVFIRWNRAIPILKKVLAVTNDFCDDKVLSQKPFGFRTYERGVETKTATSVTLVHSDGTGYVERASVAKNANLIDWYKVIVGRFVPSNGEIDVKPGQGFRVTTSPRILNAGEVCTETYIVVNAFETKAEAKNFVSYYTTKFMRFLLKLAVSSVNISKDVFTFVPKQDFSRSWSDNALYRKYNLSDEEIAFIEFTMRSMDDASVVAPSNPHSADIAKSSITVINDDYVVRYYGESGNDYDFNAVGSWRIPCSSEKAAKRVCQDAIQRSIVKACAHETSFPGNIIFYIDGTAETENMALLEWLLDNTLIPRKSDGSLTDVFFTYDIQTSPERVADLRLSDFVDLTTGKKKE